MSTRGYYGIKKKGELKGTYNHCDSYPSGLGIDLLESIRKISILNRLPILNKTFDYIELVDETSTPTKEQIAKCKSAGLVDLSVSDKSEQDWYCLLRNAQGNLSVYINQVVPYMTNGNDFFEDTLWCEWAYIIDLDNSTFCVYSNGTLQLEMSLLKLNKKALLRLEQY